MSHGVIQRGYSLLEVLVAMAILGFSLGALYQSVGGSVRSVVSASNLSRAVVLAESLLMLHDHIPSGGGSWRGSDEAGFEWLIEARKADGEVAPIHLWPLYRVDVDVSWYEAAKPRSLRLSTLRPERSEGMN